MLNLIVAYTANRVIGKDGKIPWNIPGEQQRFKDLTTGHTVIMGRKSYEEIGRPLPNRRMIIISKTKVFQHVITVPSLQDALKFVENDTCFISGGARLYEEALPLVDTMYITHIDANIPGDTYFPKFDETQWNCTIERTIPGPIPYRYATYTRK